VKAFFLASERPRLLALLRLALGLALLYDALAHWRYAVETYSTYGPAMPIFTGEIVAEPRAEPPASVDHRAPAPRLRAVSLFPVPGPRIAVLADTALVFAIISLLLGWHTKSSLAAAFFLSLWLGPLDLPATFGKQSVIALHLLLLLIFSRCGAAWSVDAWLDGKKPERCVLASVCPRRLMQILVCCVYFGAAVTKLKTPAFASGDLLAFSLLDYQWGSGWFGLWLTTLPHLPLLLSLATLLFEILFPFLVWLTRLRLPLVALAVAVHAAMAFFLRLGPFSPIMIAALFSFLEDRHLAAISRFIGRFGPWRQPALAIPFRIGSFGDSTIRRLLNSAGMNWGLYAFLVAGFVGAGYAVQAEWDWYGAFGHRMVQPLQEVSASEVAEMFAQRSPAFEDYFHRIEVGSRYGGNQMFGSSTKFRIGQHVFVLAQLIQPHPAMEWEGVLIAPRGEEVARFTHRLEKGTIYAVDGFELAPGLPPGPYRLILQAEGFVIAERRFELEP